MKKLICILLTILVCFTFASCSCAKKSKDSTPATNGSDKDVGADYPDNWE